MSAILHKVNESEGFVETDDYGIILDLWEQFSFTVFNYKFTNAGRSGSWDGKIRLVNLATRKFPLGLAVHIKKYLEQINEKCELDEEISESFYSNENKENVEKFLSQFKFYSKKNEIIPRDDQKYAVLRSIEYNRCINICPTSFGKSLAIFMQCLWHIKNKRKIIIIVPTVDLVHQFYNDIIDYCTDENDLLKPWTPKMHCIYSGKEKILPDGYNIAISTWQSIHKLEPTFINQFDVITLDECHGIKGTSIQKVFNNAIDVKYRTGWTGSLEEKVLNQLNAEGLIGPIKHITDTKTLMDDGIVADIHINVLQLKYDEETCKQVAKLDYQNEIKFIMINKKRTLLLAKLLSKMNKTGLVLFRNIAHGDKIVEALNKVCPEKNIYYIHGNFFQLNGQKYKTLEELKIIMEKEENAVVVANYQVFSTGLSVKNLHYIMFAAPVKSFITVVQSIGRGLRVSKTKNKVQLIDVVDDLSYIPRTKKHLNYCYKHFQERFKIYTEKGREFPYSIKKIDI